MNAWLLYTHLNKGVNPNPGPCRNECLLVIGPDQSHWIPKPDLIMSAVGIEGDYRRINMKAWNIFCELYPGSGPQICATFHKVGCFICSQFGLRLFRTMKFPRLGSMTPLHGWSTKRVFLKGTRPQSFLSHRIPYYPHHLLEAELTLERMVKPTSPWSLFRRADLRKISALTRGMILGAVYPPL